MISIRDRVRFEETDLMAVVYHSRYLPWLEMGRVAYLRACGVDLNEMMAVGILFPIREINVKYKHSARFDDEYEVQTSMREFNRAKMVFAYKVTDVKSGKVFVEGTTTNVFTDKNGKILRLPAEWFDRINAMYQQEKLNTEV
ncbi:MAG: acyl-CoA thioesterase [Acidaminococcaceae bacterium]|nr:acyl-CoA thioesterase [Acidaminococcaceae bacterium]MBQ9698192.1 acyl-CoA thioesterase [Acidaminococcaceae bacterium]